jgi:hypothetical protein
MSARNTESGKLDTQEAREMKHLTHELTELLNKISKIVERHVGVTNAQYNLVTVIMPSTDNPLQIAFQNRSIFNVQSVPVHAQEYEVMYWLDPPGVCTQVPACVA